MRLFSSDRVASIMDRMGIEEGEVISGDGHETVRCSKVEVRNFGIENTY